MPLHGKFVINDADYAPLTIYGVGTFMAWSGNDIYRNKGGCVAIPDNGPLPPGKYWIVVRASGGPGSIAKALIKDTANGFLGDPSNHWEWFALYRDDARIDDFTWINGVQRGQFRLHPAAGQKQSLGCITLLHKPDFQLIRTLLLHTNKIRVPRAEGLLSYGTIEVVSYGNSCP
ncbi:DUF2778 domain-containing protein [Pantoea sp. FN0305]|uniref:DUF2778 domain-containing protein n=1 Tax=Pantoea sp. FN0305 TaxID=3418559 RepID=UPI003CECD297